MEKIDFTLKPWPGADLRGTEIGGSITRKAGTLALGYRISGPLRDIEIPSPVIRPGRRIGLWENTCLEFFIAEPVLPRYWEFNLSPSGEWNVFRFERYRQGLYEETAFTELPFEVRRESSEAFHLHLEFDVSRIIQAHRGLEVAVSAVIQMKSGLETLWALTHPESGADFHHRSGFIIRL
jgi:hypothetical protein